ncbi:Caffeine resistance protein 5 [Colletotrichum sp. SAR11_240]|nr:Caffeine resistance protein 5 [Colletotrichum sp. SAR11_240]
MDLLHDTPFGILLNFLARGKIKQLQYYEEKNPEIWRRYIEPDASDRSIANSSQEGVPEQAEGASQVQSEVTDVRVDSEKGEDMRLVEFLPGDPENPLNWSLFKKTFATFQICLLTIAIYIGSAIYAAGVRDVSVMVWSPISEAPQIGRNPVYIGSIALFVLLQIPTVLSVNFGMLLAFRFITGFVGSPVLAVGGASLAEIWRPQKRAYAICIWGIAAVCGPTMGPVISGFAVDANGWTWTILELIWIGGFTFILLFVFLPETSSSNILFRRTRRIRKLTGNDKLISRGELMAETMTRRDVVQMLLVRPFTLNFTEPMVFLLNLYTALIYGLLYIWFESFAVVFRGIYGFNTGLIGLSFLGIFVGAVIIVPPFFWYLHKYLEPEFDENGFIQPEKRLPPAFLGGVAIPICLFWFGWSSRQSINWIMPIIGSAWFSIGSFLLFNPVLNYLTDAYPDYAASVLAGNDLFRNWPDIAT